MLLKKVYECSDGSIQMGFVIYKCKYCGHLFIKLQNRRVYCSDKCSKYAHKEQKEAYNRRYRLQNKDKSDNYWGLGSGYLGSHCNKDDFEKEHQAIILERKRLKLKIFA